jgi:hypothetical protein
MWSVCQSPVTCTDPGPVKCVNPTTSYTQIDLGGRAPYYSVAAASPDRVLTIVPTTPGFVTTSMLTSFLARTMAPDGTAIVDGAFFDRGGAEVFLHNAIWVAPYFYVAWHEQPSVTTWLGRLDHEGKAVGAPLALGTNGASVRVGAGGGRIAVAYMGKDGSPYKTVLNFVDPATFTLGATRTLHDGDISNFAAVESIALLGDTVAVGVYTYNQFVLPGVILAHDDGTSTQLDFTKGSDISTVTANGGTFLACSADADGDFGPGRAAFHQWCRTVSPEGALGPRAELGYRSNFLDIQAAPFGGGFAVNLPGGDKDAVGLSGAWEHLAILGLDGTVKQQFATNLPAPSGSNGAPAMVITDGCVDLIDFDVKVSNAPSAENSTLQRYCEAACP